MRLEKARLRHLAPPEQQFGLFSARRGTINAALVSVGYDLAMEMTLEDFDTLARGRRATRHFRPDPIPEGLLERIVDAARWAPSGYNLQPTHFVIVTDPKIRAQLCPACMSQAQVNEAPALIVLAGDRRVAKNQFDDVMKMDRDVGSIDAHYETLLRKVVPLAFGHGPLGLGWLWKALLVPIARLARPLPEIPAVHKRYWVTKQVMLCGMNLMLAASAAGLATVPMEGFDERRVRRILGIPRTFVVPLIVVVGYATPAKLTKTRLPLARFIHRDRW